MTHGRSDEMNRILERKSGAYADFLSATSLLKKALEAEEMAAVTRLIERRAALIEVIEGLDREIVRCRKAGPDNQIGETVRRRAAISAGLGEKLRQIVTENRDCDAVAAERVSRLREELRNLHEKEEGLHGYTHPAGQIPKFLNVRT